MSRFKGIKHLIPIVLLVVFITITGGLIIHKMWSDERAEQRAWEEVLDADFQASVKARQAMVLVNKLEKLQEEYPDGSPEADSLKRSIVELWPNFDRTDGDGRLTVPSVKTMRRQLELYARR